MSRRRFDEILGVHKTYITPFPAYKDGFHPIQEFIAAWNANMHMNYSPSWIVCLDESMSLWTNMFTCPGFVFCPRKPWDRGNEYHTIACGFSTILYFAEMVEGKARPNELGPPEFNINLGKTIGLLLRITKSIWNSGQVIILDSGLCVLKGIVELGKKVLYAGALIKKRRYWPKFLKEDIIKEHFVEKNVGDVDVWQRKNE